MIYEFPGGILNTDRLVLLRDGDEVPVEPQVFDVLRCLVEGAGSLVSKDDLIETVWGGRIVSDATISARINAARTAVGDDGARQAIIRTVPRRGFEFVAPVKTVDRTPERVLPARQTIRYAQSADGTGIAWSETGEGPPLVISWHHLSHLENDWNAPLLKTIMRDLSQGYRTIRFDIRGAGLSEPLKPGDGVDQHVEDLMAVAGAAGLERFPVVAFMQGAAVAATAAARYPERISKLVFSNAYARGRLARTDALKMPEHDPFIALLQSGGWGDKASGFMRAWATMAVPAGTGQDIEELIDLIGQVGSAEDALLQRSWIDQINILTELGKVTCPTRIVHARLCAIHPVQEGRRMASGIAGSEFFELDCPNAIPISSDDTTRQFVELAREFLADGVG